MRCADITGKRKKELMKNHQLFSVALYHSMAEALSAKREIIFEKNSSSSSVNPSLSFFRILPVLSVWQK